VGEKGWAARGSCSEKMEITSRRALGHGRLFSYGASRKRKGASGVVGREQPCAPTGSGKRRWTPQIHALKSAEWEGKGPEGASPSFTV